MCDIVEGNIGIEDLIRWIELIPDTSPDYTLRRANEIVVDLNQYQMRKRAQFVKEWPESGMRKMADSNTRAILDHGCAELSSPKN